MVTWPTNAGTLALEIGEKHQARLRLFAKTYDEIPERFQSWSGIDN